MSKTVDFVRLACGCIAIPLEDVPTDPAYPVPVLRLYHCSDGDRDSDPYGLRVTTARAETFGRLKNGDKARPLSHHEIEAVLDQLNLRMGMGRAMRDLCGAVKWANELKSEWSDSPPPCAG